MEQSQSDKINKEVIKIVNIVNNTRRHLSPKDAWAALSYAMASIMLTYAVGDRKMAEDNIEHISKSMKVLIKSDVTVITSYSDVH